MKKAAYSFTFIIIGLTLLIQSCTVVEEYDITVINDTDFDFSVYLDDDFQFRLGAGGMSVIRNVDEGRYTIDARDGNEIIAEERIRVDRDIEWTVFVERYEITVINSTGADFSVYLDGVFQFDLRPGYSRTITGVSEGTHTIDARIVNVIIADETFFVDSDVEWEVY